MKSRKQKVEIRKPKKQVWCVWVKHPLRYVEATDRQQARQAYLKLLRRFSEGLAVIEYSRAKAMGFSES